MAGKRRGKAGRPLDWFSRSMFDHWDEPTIHDRYRFPLPNFFSSA